MRILLTGSRGYIGRSLALELICRDYFVIGVDNGSRESWAEITGEQPYMPFLMTHKNFIEIIGNLSNRDLVNEILTIWKPDVIIHCASQPSLPYANLNGERALFTQINNISMNLNLLWGIKELGLKTKYIILTTTGVPGTYYENIPEGDTLNKAGSFYHISRGFDSENCNMVSRLWGQEIIEFRTSIVYGIQTNTMREWEAQTRFDTQTFFGTALNRFIDQALKGDPLTVYGEGHQTKPFISLNDTIISLVNAISYKFTEKHTILNQTTLDVSINDLAELVRQFTNCEIKHIPNPRKENESWQMHFENKKFLEVLGKEPDEIGQGIKAMIETLSKKN